MKRRAAVSLGAILVLVLWAFITAQTQQNAIEVDEFPDSEGTFTIETPRGVQQVTLVGPTTVHVFFEGSNEGDAQDDDGNGLDEVQTEIVSMELKSPLTIDQALDTNGNGFIDDLEILRAIGIWISGAQVPGTSQAISDAKIRALIEMWISRIPIMGQITVRVRDAGKAPFQRSLGQIEEQNNNTRGTLDLPPFTPNGRADSFFDVFFEVEIGGMGIFHSERPKHMTAVIDHKPPDENTTYENPDRIELFDENGNRTGIFITAGEHVPDPGDGDRDDKPRKKVEVDEFPDSAATFTIEGPFGSGDITLRGPTTVHVFFEGPNEGDTQDDDGNGLDEVQTEIVSMELSGNTFFGPVKVRVRDAGKAPFQRSLGQIEEQNNNTPGVLDLPPFVSSGQADSFFDVFFEVEIPGIGLLHSERPKHMTAVIDHKPPDEGTVYENPDRIELFDERGNPTGIFITGGRHVLEPEEDDGGIVEVDRFPNSEAVFSLEVQGREHEITLRGLTEIHVFFEGPREGDARDNDGNGRDEVQTEIVEMKLTGDSPFGPIEVRVSKDRRSLGQIEERRNDTPGILDLPPFKRVGTADSFFDIFFEIEVGDLGVFHTEKPKHMSTIIDHKPPGEGTVYENPDRIQLFDERNNPVDIFITAGRHTPDPEEGDNGDDDGGRLPPFPPVITGIEAPSAIIGDEALHPVGISFEDPNGDLAQLRVQTLQGPNAGHPAQTFDLNFQGLTTGFFNLDIFCLNIGDEPRPFPVTEQVTLIDAFGLESQPNQFTYTCLPAQ